MRNTYILDTSVLMDYPNVYPFFKDSDIIIPITVINELDKNKQSINPTKARNARLASRVLDELSKKGEIHIGVQIEDNIIIRIDPTHHDLSSNQELGDPSYGDTRILACALDFHYRLTKAIFVSNDLNLRVKASSRGMQAIGFEDQKHSLSELYIGHQTIVNEDAGLDLQNIGMINPLNYGIELFANEFVTLTDSSGKDLSIGRKIAENKIKLVKKQYPWKLAARNKEQTLAYDILMDKSIDLVTLIGFAGCGKTLISCAAALEMVINSKEYEKLIIYRPIQSVGKEIGFLPGTEMEKLAPWFAAIMDSFEHLFTTKNGGDWHKDFEMYQKRGRIELGAITYIRGRSIANAIILIDESQNLSKDEIKTILSRAGENTKVILTGDISQIDNSYLDAINNGLTYVVEKFKPYNLAGHITLMKGERSKLATLSAEIL